MTVSRVAVLVWAIIMGIAMCIAQVANINVNWLVLLIGAHSYDSSPLCHVHSWVSGRIFGDAPFHWVGHHHGIAMCIAHVANANVNCPVLLIGAPISRSANQHPLSSVSHPGIYCLR